MCCQLDFIFFHAQNSRELKQHRTPPEEEMLFGDCLKTEVGPSGPRLPLTNHTKWGGGGCLPKQESPFGGHVRMLSYFTQVWLFATPWTVAHQAPLSMGFSRQEYWSGLPCPPPGDLYNPGIKSMSLAFHAMTRWVLHHWATWGVPFINNSAIETNYSCVLE